MKSRDAEQSGSRATYRTLDLIAELSRHPTGATVAILAEQLRIPASTVHRLLQALVDRRFAVQDLASRRYAIGPLIVSLIDRAAGGVRLATLARPTLERLFAETHETVFLSTMDGDEIVYLDCIVSTRPVQVWGAVGVRAPVYSTSQGKAMLAFLPSADAERIVSSVEFVPATEQTIRDKKSLLRELIRVRERGFAINNEEHGEGIRAVAAPILDASGCAIAAVCLGAPAYRMPLARLNKEIAPLVMCAAKEISQHTTAFELDDRRRDLVGQR